MLAADSLVTVGSEVLGVVQSHTAVEEGGCLHAQRAPHVQSWEVRMCAVSIDYLGERRAIRIGVVMCCSVGCALALPLGSHA